MKKILNLALITILTLSAAKVQARVFSANEIKAKISEQVVANYQQYTDAELRANVIALPFESLKLPDGQVSFAVTSMIDKFMPRDLQKIVVSVNNKPFRTFNAPVEVKAYKVALVATDFIDRDRVLNSNCVVCKKVEISDKMGYTLTSDLLNKEIITKKPFKEGEVIDKRFVKLKPDVQRNSEVTAFFSKENLQISIDAVALSDGMTGDYIGVENRNFRKTYTGKIIGENKVLIEI